MNYQRYKYKEEDVSTLIELATESNKPCVQVYKENSWPFSLNVLNGFLVGRRAATTDRLQVAIQHYKKSYARYANYSNLSDTVIKNVVSLRTNGLSFKEISQKTGLKTGLVVYLLSGKMKHPSAPNEKIVVFVKRGRKKSFRPPKPPQPPKPPKPPKATKPPKQIFKPLTNRGLINVLVNALGSPHFDPDQVIEVLAKEADRIRQEGGNPGSLITLANILPEITAEAKKRY